MSYQHLYFFLSSKSHILQPIIKCLSIHGERYRRKFVTARFALVAKYKIWMIPNMLPQKGDKAH